MSLYAKIGLILALMGFATWAYNEIYDAGETKAELACTTEKKDQADAYTLLLNEAAEREREANAATDSIAKAYHATIITEVENNAALQKKLSDKSAIKDCIKNDAGQYTAYLSDDAIGMLNQCSQATTLPAATEEQGFVTENKVTSTDLARYTCKAISQYNRCGIEVNKAIEEQDVNGESL